MSVFTTYKVQSGDTLYAISRKFSMGVDEIKAVNSLQSNNLNIGQVLKVRSSVGAITPTPAPTTIPQAQSTATSSDFSHLSTYTVAPGDSLYRISAKFGMSVDDLKAMNGLTSNNLSIGQLLEVRSSGGSTVQTPVPAPPASVPSGGNSNLLNYKVVAGDSLYRISTKFGMGVDELKSINGLNSNILNIGQILKVRSVGGTSMPTPSPTPPPIPTPPPVTPVSGNYMSARQQFPFQVRQDAGFNRYILTVPLLNGGQVVASMRDNVTISRYMVYPQGIMYGGQSQIELDIATIESVGLNEKQAKALQYVSVHEGKFDAINSYDKAIFSYGFIQFAAAAAVGSSLNRLLASMKTYAPAAFQKVFQSVGIDSEGSTTLASTTVLTESGMKLRSDDAWLYIQRNVNLYGAFVQAAYDASLVREQLRMANELYVQPALNFKLDVVLGGLRITIPRLRDVLSSEAAMTAVVALAVNQGVGGMSRIVANSVSAIASQSGLTSQQTLAHVNEQQVLQHIADTATDERVKERTNGVLRSDLSYAKA